MVLGPTNGFWLLLLLLVRTPLNINLISKLFFTFSISLSLSTTGRGVGENVTLPNSFQDCLSWFRKIYFARFFDAYISPVRWTRSLNVPDSSTVVT